MLPKSKLGARTLTIAAAAIAIPSAAIVTLSAVSAVSAPAPALQGQVKVAARRLTESQYRNSIADVFGAWVRVDARFEPERRQDGLLAIGSTQLSITPSGFEQYYAAARAISDQVLSEDRRDAAVGCKPKDAQRADDACAAAFVRSYGERLFRRPLTDAQVAARVQTARKGENFYDGLKLALTSLLIAPEFLFRIEVAEPDPSGAARLDGYTKAARISFLLWDAAPDAELLAAARSGLLDTEEGLKQQVARLQASPRIADGVRAFFTDMLQLDAFEGLTKDPSIYPKFSQAVADSAREETLRTIVDQLVTKKRDYRELFTTRETWINRNLAAVYKVPFASKEKWAPYTFPADSGRSGILTQVTFLSLFSHPGSSSPTKRGVKLYEIFFGQPTPDPPADVDFSKVQASSKGTVRMRLIDHMTNEGCSSCHSVSDPVGLALEHFDSIGQIRMMEDGQLIDVSAVLGGKNVAGAQGVGQFMHDNPRVSATLVRNVFSYGVGRALDERDDPFLEKEVEAFIATGYKVPDLFGQIAASPYFMKVVIPSGAKPATANPRQVAAINPKFAKQGAAQ
jgi:hypothetical protein